MGTVVGVVIGLVLAGIVSVVGIFRFAAFFPSFGRWLIRTFPRYGHVFVDEPRNDPDDR